LEGRRSIKLSAILGKANFKNLKSHGIMMPIVAKWENFE
jgi:hypothetical protein